MLSVLTCLDRHDPQIVGWALAICVVTAVASLGAYRHALDSRGVRRLGWIVLVSVILGSGVWATHFTAMLAYHLDLSVGFGLHLTALSLAAAILGMGTGVAIAALNPRSWAAALGGAICGVSIVLMHFIGVAAMNLPAHIDWNLRLVAVAIAFGVCGAAAAFGVAGHLRRWEQRAVSALLLIIAVCGTHFTAMSAAVLLPGAPPLGTKVFSPEDLAIGVGVLSFLIVAACVGLLAVDRRSREIYSPTWARPLTAHPAAWRFSTVTRA